MTVLPSVPEEVLAAVAADPAGLHYALRDALRSRNPQVAHGLATYLAALPDDAVAATLADRQFQFFASRSGDLESEARLWLAQRIFATEIPRRRITLLRSETTTTRPTPYNIPALSDLRIDSDGLVPLSSFEFDGSRLCRRDYAFTVLCTAESPNSTYWLLHAIYEAEAANHTSVRLDPLLWGPADTFHAMFYRMWIYGRPIDWNRIGHLRAPEHGRWQPGSLSRRSQFTDFVWSPRGPQVHFIAEEVPMLEDALTAGARYLHAIYEPATKLISHLDGALRLYALAELQSRHRTHVRHAGKAGFRQKVFRADAPIPSRNLSAIVQAFFVWNYDVSNYFTTAITADA